MLRTLEQNKRYHTLLGKLGIVDSEQKEELVYAFTKERTVHSSSMTMEEMNALCGHLQGMIYAADDRANVMRKKIFSICHELNWKLPNGNVDVVRLENWLIKFGYLHKELNKYSEKELPMVVTQMEKLLK